MIAIKIATVSIVIIVILLLMLAMDFRFTLSTPQRTLNGILQARHMVC